MDDLFVPIGHTIQCFDEHLLDPSGTTLIIIWWRGRIIFVQDDVPTIAWLDWGYREHERLAAGAAQGDERTPRLSQENQFRAKLVAGLSKVGISSAVNGDS
jgi:hypothetical protein